MEEDPLYNVQRCRTLEQWTQKSYNCAVQQGIRVIQ